MLADTSDDKSLRGILTSLPHNGSFPKYDLLKTLCDGELECATETLRSLLQLISHMKEIDLASSNAMGALLEKLQRQASFEHLMECTHGSLRFDAMLRQVQVALQTSQTPGRAARVVDDIRAMKRHLEGLLAAICSVNLYQLRQFLEQGTGQAEKVAGKDLVILVGNTGSGKSTAILHIAGVTFEIGESERGLRHFFSKGGMKPDMESFVTAPDSRSITQFINVLQMPESGPCLCDTPGFADTRSPEIDLSNGLNTVKALHNAKSVRLVVVCECSAVTEGRAGMFKQLLSTLTSLVRDAQHHKESIAFLFTKVGDDMTFGRLVSYLKDVREELTDQENRQESYTALLERAIESASDKSAILLRAENLQSGDTSRQALEMLSSLKLITNPQDVFQKVGSSTSYKSLQSQLKLHMDAIRVACGATTRGASWNVRLLLHRLNDLRDLGSFMENDAQLKRTYEEACQLVCNQVESLTSQIMDELIVDAPFTEKSLGTCMALFGRLGEVEQSRLLKLHLLALDGCFHRSLKLLWETQSTLLKRLQNCFAPLLAQPRRLQCVVCNAGSQCDGELAFDLPMDTALDSFSRLRKLERYLIVHVQEWLKWPGGA